MPDNGERPDAGTTKGGDGEPAERTPDSATPPEAGREAGGGEATEKDWKALYLSSKEKIEGFDAAQERIRALEAQLGEGGPEGGPAGGVTESDNARELAELEEEEQELLKLERDGDPLARALRRQNQRELALRRDIADVFTYQNTKDEELRDRAVRIYQNPKNKGRFGSLRDVLDVLERDKLKKDNEELRKEVDKLRTGEGKPREAVRTGKSEPVNGKQEEVEFTTKAAFDEKKEEAYRAGDMATYRQMQRDLLAGKIQFRKTAKA